LAIGQDLDLSPDPQPVHFLEEETNGAQLQIALEKPADPFGLLLDNDQLLVLVDVTQRDIAAHE
jgi:hypothetical protein